MHWKLGSVMIFCLASCTASDQGDAPQASTKGMMADHVQPTAEVYWNAVQYISDADGSREIIPENDAEWQRTAQAAQKLKQLGEDLKMTKYAANKGTDWKDFAQGLVDAAGQAEQAAQAHSPEKVLEAGGILYNVCSACHEVYMPAPGGLAPTDQSNPITSE